MKVAIVVISLSKGGAERSTALLSKMLVSKGIDVYLITLTDAVVYDFSGKLFNLGRFKSDNDTGLDKFKHLKRLKNYIKENNFDFIIDNRTRGSAFKEFLYLNYIYSKQEVIYVVRSFHLANYFPKNKWIASQLIQRAAKIVGVSKAISEEVNQNFNTQKTVTIYNPLPEFEALETNEPEIPYILFLGRIEEDVKNFTLLLKGYQLSKLSENGVQLKIYGDGKDKNALVRMIEDLDLTAQVSVHSFTPNIYLVLKNALFLTLTSRYEGFPRVLLEALSVGTPVVSVNCKSGPDEIIIDQHNGLLVENFNEQALADAMNRFIFDTSLYQNCKANAVSSVQHLQQDNIAQLWLNLLRNEKPKN
ncbi:MAG: glycosyltransferase [Flavobacteriaceae bacterium]